jgi:hypothetical protein
MPRFSEVHSLRCDTGTPILEVWKREAAQNGRPPWAPTPDHSAQLDDAELPYVAKIKVLTEMSDHIYNVSFK